MCQPYGNSLGNCMLCFNNSIHNNDNNNMNYCDKGDISNNNNNIMNNNFDTNYNYNSLNPLQMLCTMTSNSPTESVAVTLPDPAIAQKIAPRKTNRNSWSAKKSDY